MAVHVLTDEQKKLIENNIPLAYFLAKRINHPHIEYEDAVQLALLGFCKAARLYDPEKSKFTTLASLAAQHTIQMEERKYMNEVAKRIYTGRSLDKEVHFEYEGTSSPFHEIVPDPRQNTYKQVEALITLDAVNTFKASLKPRDRVIFEECILADMNQRDVAKKLGLSQSYISRIARQLMVKLNGIIGLEEPA